MNLGAQCSTVDTTVTVKEDIHLPWTQLGSFENHYHKVGKGSQLWEIRAAKECNHNNITRRMLSIMGERELRLHSENTVLHSE